MRKKDGFNAKRKLAAATAMLTISALMLSSATYAWFTMNKEVTVTGMELKAHAEEGLLINEVKLATDTNWDDAAQGDATPTTVVLRPASTSNMVTWWHANAKKSYDEAGIGELDDTVDIAGVGKYLDISPANVEDNIVVAAEGAESGTKATGGTRAETHVYYKDASFGNNDDTYQDGEGFYVKYTYYLKSSGQADLTVSNLQAKVKATKKTGDTGDSENLMKSLRVGIAVPASNASNAAIAGYKIFAPVNGADASYSVTTLAAGTSSSPVTATVAGTTGQFTEYVRLNNSDGEETPTYSTITIPDVNEAGIPVYVYVWFEGEDQACKSDNLTATLSTYDIDISFNYADTLY